MQNLSKLLRQHAAKLTRKLNEAADLLEKTTIDKPTTGSRKGRKMSASARRKIAKAQIKRWKLYHGKKAA